MASNALLDELIRLPVDERLDLLEALWDSIPDDDETLALTPEQGEDLDRRIEEAQAKPTDGDPWGVVRDRIRQRRR